MPYSTREVEGSSVVQLMVAVPSAAGTASTAEMTGGSVSGPPPP